MRGRYRNIVDLDMQLNERPSDKDGTKDGHS